MSHRTYHGTHVDKSRSSKQQAVIAGSCVALTLASAAIALVVTLFASTSSASSQSVTASAASVMTARGITERGALTHSAGQLPRRPAAWRPSAVTVARGDTLSVISRRVYGAAGCWPGIFRWNERTIGANPDFIMVGERLVIPAACSTALPAAYRHRAEVTVSYRSYGSHRTPRGGSGAGIPAASGGLSGRLSFGQLEQLWEAARGPRWAAWSAAAIAECESGGNQYAYNPSGASGYWQILGEVVPGYIFNPMVNAENAVAKFTGAGDTFAAWVCRA